MIANCNRSPRALLAPLLLAVALLGCAAAQTVAKDAIDVSLAACMAEHSNVTEPDVMKTVCPYDEAFGPLVEKFLAGRKRGLKKYGAPGCGGDAGK